MPSRAVVRKKARKEKSLRKKYKLSEPDAHKRSHHPLGSTNPTLPKKISIRATVTAETDTIDKPEEKTISTTTGIIDLDRESCNVSALTHKERKKLEAKKRFEKQVKRASNELSSVTPSSDEKPTTSSEEKLRHDPRFKNGTFWRERKEKRARTLFLGGIPLRFSVENVIDFIMTLMDGNEETYKVLQNLPEGTSAVEKVDFLPVNAHSKVRNMFVTVQSVSLAGYMAKLLNGYKLEQYALRCNFVADKTERAEAIRRRAERSNTNV